MELINVKFGLQGITGKFVGASDSYIVELEQQFGFTLPRSYREFLQKFGASLFTEDVGFRPIEPSPWAVNGMESFDGFYGMSHDPRFDLQRVNTRLRGVVAEMMTVIGHDPGSNLLLLSASGEVYFYDRETGKQYLCARDFGSFLSSFEKRSM